MREINTFINFLKFQGKSTNSIKNYKTDVQQFVRWSNDNYPEDNYSSTFPEYCYVLSQKFSRNSTKRKVSSISMFLQNISRQTAEAKNESPKVYLLPHLSLAISLASLIIMILLFSNYKGYVSVDKVSIPSNIVVSDGKLENVKKISNGNNLQLVISAPSVETVDTYDTEYKCIPSSTL